MEIKKENSHKKSQKTLLCLLCLFVAILPLSAQRPPVTEDAFKNIQVLKGITVDEFMNTMGVFSAALGVSCEDWPAPHDATWANYALDTSPRTRVARRMA